MVDLVEESLLAERRAKRETLLKDRFAERVSRGGGAERVVGVWAGGC